MAEFTVEAEIIAIEEREGGAAIVFQSKRQSKSFAINLEGNEELKVGDRMIVAVSVKPKKTKRASSKSAEV